MLICRWSPAGYIGTNNCVFLYCGVPAVYCDCLQLWRWRWVWGYVCKKLWACKSILEGELELVYDLRTQKFTMVLIMLASKVYLLHYYVSKYTFLNSMQQYIPLVIQTSIIQHLDYPACKLKFRCTYIIIIGSFIQTNNIILAKVSR